MGADVLYTFRRCPYAMRARWAIIMTGKTVVWREVDLKNKPKELLEISPKGTVPVLIKTNGEIIEESIGVIYWALEGTTIYKRVGGKNKKQKEEIKEIINTNDNILKYHLDRYKYSDHFVQSEKEMHRSKARQILLEWNQKIYENNKGDCSYLLGNETIADWSVWPFVRQYSIADPKYFYQDEQLSELKEWLYRYLNDKNFPSLMLKKDPWHNTDQISFFP